jgi:hypothetical protein
MSIKNCINKKWLIVQLAFVMLVGVISASLPVGSVYAESNTIPTSTPAPLGTGASNFFAAVLERTYKFQTKMLDIFSNRLNNADKIETRAQQRITELKLQGKDVSSLENMLSKFYDLITSVKQAKDKASATLNLHQGFNAQGKVTDLKLARETTKSVEENIRICRENIVQALRIITDGLKVYRQQNSPQPASSVK